MCQYTYYEFEQCGHRQIDLPCYCKNAEWRAGLTGQLRPCPEHAFHGHLNRAALGQGLNPEHGGANNDRWYGMAGICKACVLKRKVPQPAKDATLVDSSMSTFSSEEVALQILAHDGVQDVAVAPERWASLEHPYVHLPALNQSVFTLLGISHHYDTKSQSTCKILFFPSSTFLYTEAEWAIGALVNGNEIEIVPNKYLFINCGLTPLDRRYIDTQIARGVSAKDIYRVAYEHRGTNEGMFLRAVAEREIIPEPDVRIEAHPRGPQAPARGGPAGVIAPANQPNRLGRVNAGRISKNADRRAAAAKAKPARRPKAAVKVEPRGQIKHISRATAASLAAKFAGVDNGVNGFAEVPLKTNKPEPEPRFGEPQFGFAAPRAPRPAEDLSVAAPVDPRPANDFGFGWDQANAFASPATAGHESNSPGVASMLSSPEHQPRSDCSGSASPATPVDHQLRNDLLEVDAGPSAPVGLGLYDGDLLNEPLFPTENPILAAGNFINPNEPILDDTALEGYAKFNGNNDEFDFDAELARLLALDRND